MTLWQVNLELGEEPPREVRRWLVGVQDHRGFLIGRPLERPQIAERYAALLARLGNAAVPPAEATAP